VPVKRVTARSVSVVVGPAAPGAVELVHPATAARVAATATMIADHGIRRTTI
jgi:hypothetical protein